MLPEPSLDFGLRRREMQFFMSCASHRGGKAFFHPCMHEEAHEQVPRLHLPIAPLCNIHCRFCERKISPFETTVRCPGTAAGILSPEQALAEARRFLEQWGSASVVGIAGPGEPLANDETFITLGLIREHCPDATLCLCTNGLNLPESVAILEKLALDSLSVTVNGVEPEVVAKLQPWIKKDGRIIKGVAGARVLIKSQLAGIKAAACRGIFVKVNTVIVPSINGAHAERIAFKVREAGAALFNPIPLIPRGDAKGMRKPSRHYMSELRRRSESVMPVFGKCKQCRADAEGIPGKEVVP